MTELDAVKTAGFDYIEVRTTEIASLSDGEFAALRAKLQQLRLPAFAAYLFVPPDIKLTGPAIDKSRQMAYVTRAFDRLARLGVSVVTFGSGAARQVPDGFPRQEALAQLVDFCKRIGPEAASRHLVVAIAPQRKQTCNIINTTAEALEMVETVKHPNIQLMIDFYHMVEEREDPAIIRKAKDHLRHLHIANPHGRVFPLQAGEYDYEPFFRLLRLIGYNARISLEATTADFAGDAPRSIAFLRRVFSAPSTQ